MTRASNNHLASRLQRLRDLGRLLPKPEVLFHYERQKLDHISERLPAALVKLVQSQKMHLYNISGTLRHSFARSKVDRSAGQTRSYCSAFEALARSIDQSSHEGTRAHLFSAGGTFN